MISYVKDLYKGNDFKTISAAEFIDMLESKMPAYEYTGSETNVVNAYFDVDSYDTKFNADDAVATQNDWEGKLKEIFPEAKIAIGTSHGLNHEKKQKWSWRYWLPNIRMRKCDILYMAKMINQQLKKERDTIPPLDEGVYDNNRKMRCPNTSKDGEDRPLILVKGEIKDTLITLENEGALTMPEIPEATPKPETLTLGQVVPSAFDNCTNDIQIIQSDVYYKYLNCIGIKMCDRGKHKDTITILQILKNENVGVEHVKYWIHRYAYPTSKKYTYAIDYYENGYIKYTPLTNEKRLTIKTLKYYAKLHNPALYSYYFKDDYEYRLTKELNFTNIIEYAIIQSSFTNLYCDMKKDTLFYKSKDKEAIIYLYYNDEWNVVCNKGRLLKNDILDFITIYFKACLDIINDEEKKNINDSKATEAIKETRKTFYTAKTKMCSNYFTNQIYELVLNKLSSFKTNIEFDVGIENHFNINFKNGLYDMKNKIFRSRLPTDYITKYLDYNYIRKNDIDESIHNDVLQFFQRLQPDEDQRRFTLSYLAYCLTGDATKQVFKMNIGYTASNGKSTELAIHDKCFEIYTEKLDSKVLLLNYDKRHKHIYRLIDNPTRLVYFEEMPKGKKLDVEFIKEFVDGKKIKSEIMFGNTDKITIQAKIMSVSNHDFSVDTDEGILRRGRVQFYNSKFVNDESQVDESKHIYKKIDGFENKFNDEKYKNAYFHLLLNYVDVLHIPKKNEEEFKQTAEASDEVLNALINDVVITKNENDWITKKQLETLYGKDMLPEFKAKLQSKGCKWDSQKKGKFNDKWHSGVFTGVRIKTSEEYDAEIAGEMTKK